MIELALAYVILGLAIMKIATKSTKLAVIMIISVVAGVYFLIHFG